METRRTLVGRRVLGASLIAAITSWRTRGFGLAHESTPVEETGDMQRTSTFHVTTNDRAEAIWFTGTLALIKGNSTATGGAFDQIEFLQPPGFATPLHVHHTADEAFYVLGGTMRGICDDVVWMATEGDVVWLPAGTAHGYAVYGDQPLRSLAMTMPGTLADFVREAGTPALSLDLPPADLEVDFSLVAAAATKHGQTILGPPVTDLG